MAQWIQVIWPSEENTRHATHVLEKLTTLTQQVRDRMGGAGDRGTGPWRPGRTRRRVRAGTDLGWQVICS